jgi:hypothetical protein
VPVSVAVTVGEGRVVVVNVVVVPGVVGMLVPFGFVGVTGSEWVGMVVASCVSDDGNGSVIVVGVCVVGWLFSSPPHATNQTDAAAVAASENARTPRTSLLMPSGPSLIVPPDR